MSKSWKLFKLAELYDISSGLSKSAEEFGFGFPFLSFTNVFNNYFLPDQLTQLVNSSKKEQIACSIRKGDVFLTRTSEVIEELGMSSVALVDYPCATFNGFTKRLRPKDNSYIDPKFIGYYLRSPQFRAEITAYSSLTTRASLNNGIIERLKVYLPSLPIQQKIASILSAYDELLENNKQRIKLLEEMAEEIYKEWFVRFRFPGYESTKFFDEKGREAPHGTPRALPEGWQKIDIDKAFDIVGGGTPSTTRNEFWEGGTINWFSPTDITNSNSIFLKHSTHKITELGLKKSAARIFPSRSVMMTSRATIGAIGINLAEACTNQGFITCLPNSNFSYIYIYEWLKTSKEEIENNAGGATFKEITRTTFKKMKILKPTQAVSTKHFMLLAPVFEEIKILNEKNQLLQQTRDLLLPRLISGKLSVEHLIDKEPEPLSLAAEPELIYQK